MAPNNRPESPSSVFQRYRARFGDAGEHFDTWRMPGMNIALMQMALERGTPVTEADLRRIWAERGNDPDEFALPEGVIT